MISTNFIDSTISHIGFILLALSIKSSHSIDSLLFYIIQYTITNLNIFLILLSLSSFYHYSTTVESFNNLNEYEKDIDYIEELKGLLFKNHFLSFSLIISLFSLAGIPPLLGFFAKQVTLYSAIQSNYYLLSFICIITSVISASYYLRIIKLNLLNDNTTANLKGVSFASVRKAVHIKNIKNSANAEFYNINRHINKLGYNKAFLLKGNRNNNIIKEFYRPIINTIISIITLFITFFIFKPSVLLNSTGVLSLFMWGFFY